jgi:hypothetical protein
MAGPFGFEADKFEVSKAIANDGLLPAVEGRRSNDLIVADGFSCREQIAQLSSRKAMHGFGRGNGIAICGTVGNFDRLRHSSG